MPASRPTGEPQASIPNAPVQPPRLRGFWRTTVVNRRALINWDLCCAVLLTGLGVWLVEGRTLEDALPTMLAAEFGIIGALLGLVIAGLAIIVGFLSADYAEVLMRSKGGPAREFWPFWYVAGIAAVSIIVSGAGLLAVEQDAKLRYVVMGVTTFFASYAVLASVNLVGFVKAQGETRAYQLALRAEQERRSGARSNDQ